jgi:hypothetical protein
VGAPKAQTKMAFSFPARKRLIPWMAASGNEKSLLVWALLMQRFKTL